MDLPSAEPEPERYKDRPLLLLLENFVLDCIGVLPEENQPRMQEVVSQAFENDGPWQETLCSSLEFDPEIAGEIRKRWEGSQELARENGFEIHPVQFAKMCVDENFSHLVGPPSEDHDHDEEHDHGEEHDHED